MDTQVFEQDGSLYLIGDVAPIQPSKEELEEFAFSSQLTGMAPNDAILWLKGQYVEADRPNKNGQLWTSKEISIKSLTPRLMPITVMHDPRTAVGVIADTKLLTPEKDGVPRARIETALAIWSHRFPQIAEEIAANYKQGTLMQSMECAISHYTCTDCGKGYVKLPENAERANWCEHLKAASENGIAVRRLEGVTFTGTGLIFGTRNGATGALDTAHLDTFKSEVAEFHTQAKTERRNPRRTSVDEITIKRSEYDELKALAAKAGELAQRVTALETEVAQAAELTKQVETLEISLKAAEDQAVAEKTRADELAEKERSATLSGERVTKLGTKFLAALPETIKTRLQEQAKVMSDEDWTARLEELSELTKVKSDEGGEPDPAATVTTNETSSTQLGNGSPGAAPSRVAVETTLQGLFRSVRPKTPEPAAKK